MRSHALSRGLVGAVMSILVSASCTAGTGATASGSPATATSGSAAGLAAGSYKIGFVALTSGTAAFAGVPEAKGVRVAIKEINSTGFLGKGVTLALDERDAAGDPAKAINAWNQLAADSQTVGIICCTLSGETGALKPIVAKGPVPTVVMGAVLPNAADGNYLYRSRPLVPPMTAKLPSKIVPVFGIKTAVVATTADNDGLVNDAVINETELKKLGVTLFPRVDTFAADTDFSGPATKIISLKPDAVVPAMLGGNAALLIKALRDRGYLGQIIGNTGITTEDLFKSTGGALVGVVSPANYVSTATDELTVRFNNLYKAEFSEESNEFNAIGYTAGWFLARALLAGGAPTRDGLLKGFKALGRMPSVLGDLTFDSAGQAQADTFKLVQWSADGKLLPWDGTVAGQFKRKP